jgi:hypothetical protein
MLLRTVAVTFESYYSYKRASGLQHSNLPHGDPLRFTTVTVCGEAENCDDCIT